MRSLVGEDFYTCQNCAEFPERYALLGHDGQPQLWAENAITKAPLAMCPVRTFQLAPEHLRNEITRMQVQYYPLYKRGHLLAGGGVEDQPAKYMDYMLLLEATENRWEAAYMKAKAEESNSDG